MLGSLVVLIVLGTPVSAIGPGPTLNLKLAGPVPRDAAFNLYLDTDPPTAGQTGINVCALSDYTRPCVSGKTFTFSFLGYDAGTTLVFRFERWDGHRNVPFYSGRVTITAENPNPVFNVTYDYNLGMPDTAIAPPEVNHSVVGWLVVAEAALVLLFMRARQ
jgi:hypothetical protein